MWLATAQASSIAASMAHRSAPRPSPGLVLVRVVTGAVLLLHGWRWVRAGTPVGGDVRRWAEDALAALGGALAWWGKTFVLANPAGSAFLWRWAALVCGILLVLGALTRPAALVAAFFLLHAWLYGPDAVALTSLLLLASCLACALSRAGLRLGLDIALDARLPGWLSWTRRERAFLE